MPTQKTTRPRAQLRAGRTDWYRIENLGAGTACLYLYDEIGYWGTSAAGFVEELSELTGVTAIDLHINSPGGEVFDGLAIMNCLRSHPATVTVYVDGLAASIASVIAMAGDRIVMGPHSQLMIHEGSGLCIGDAAEMRRMGDLLDFQSDNIAGVYAARAGGDVAAWRALMTAETWYTAEEAVAAGLADEVAQRPGAAPEAPAAVPAEMGNSWDLSVFRYAGRDAAPDPVANTADPAEAPAAPDPVPPVPEEALVPEEQTTTAPVDGPSPDPVTAPVTPVGTPSGPESSEPVASVDSPVTPVTGPVIPVAPAATPDDEWAALTAHLTQTPSADDQFATLKEALCPS